jgi:hypothetical protein
VFDDEVLEFMFVYRGGRLDRKRERESDCRKQMPIRSSNKNKPEASTKELSDKQLLDSRDILYAELKNAEDIVSFRRNQMKALNDFMAGKGMGWVARMIMI